MGAHGKVTNASSRNKALFSECGLQARDGHRYVAAGDGNANVPYTYYTETFSSSGDSTMGHVVSDLKVLRISPDGTYAKIPLKEVTADYTALDPLHTCSGSFYPSFDLLGHWQNYGPAVITNAAVGVVVTMAQSDCSGSTFH